MQKMSRTEQKHERGCNQLNKVDKPFKVVKNQKEHSQCDCLLRKLWKYGWSFSGNNKWALRSRNKKCRHRMHT